MFTLHEYCVSVLKYTEKACLENKLIRAVYQNNTVDQTPIIFMYLFIGNLRAEVLSYTEY